MAAEVRPSIRTRPRSVSEARARTRPWWHYLIAAGGLLALAGLGWGGYAVWFHLTHVQATHARVSGYIVTISTKGDTRVSRLLVKTGDKVRAGQEVVLLDSADLEAERQKAEAQLTAQRSALTRAKADWEMTIRQTQASEQQAAAMLAAAQARYTQAQADSRMQALTQPDEVRNARARLASARANLTRLEAGPRPQEIEQARADVSAKQAMLSNATSSLARLQKLNQQGAISAQALEEAATQKQVAEADLKAANERLSLLLAGNRQEDIERARQDVEAALASVAMAQTKALEGQMKTQELATRAAERQQADAALSAARSTRQIIALKAQDYAAAQAAVAQAEAALEQAKVRFGESSLKSPVDGVVIRGAGSTIHEGEVVTKGVPIVTVVATSNRSGNPYWITGAVSEIYASQVHEGQPVIIEMEAFRNRKFRGKVEQVGGATEVSSGANETASQWMLQQVPIRVSFEDQGQPVKPGLSCRMWIDIRK